MALIAFEWSPATGVKDITQFPDEDPLLREHFQALLDQVKTYFNGNIATEFTTKVNTSDVVTTPAASKILKLGANSIFPLGSIAYQNKQTGTGTSNVFGIPIANLPQFALVTVFSATADNVNRVMATFLIKNFSGFTADLLGTKVKAGAVTDVTLNADANYLYVNVTSSVSITVRCATSIIAIGSDL